MIKSNSHYRWLIALTMFTLLWTGTFWHDFFGMEVMPAISGVISSVHVHEAECLGGLKVAYSHRHASEAPSAQVPCSCPNHVHSPSCLSKFEHTLVVSTVQLFVQVLAACIAPDPVSRDTFIPRRDAHWNLARRSGPPIYLAFRSLLI